jgi:hypothetical protein
MHNRDSGAQVPRGVTFLLPYAVTLPYAFVARIMHRKKFNFTLIYWAKKYRNGGSSLSTKKESDSFRSKGKENELSLGAHDSCMSRYKKSHTYIACYSWSHCELISCKKMPDELGLGYDRSLIHLSQFTVHHAITPFDTLKHGAIQ